MRKTFLFKWFRNVSIAKKLYFTVGIMALLIALELVVLFFSINTLSSVRAYVGGEGLWSKTPFTSFVLTASPITKRIIGNSRSS